ncbi:hypothetical protein HGA89_00375 [bacterium]|nr:hypothetical protein [bacterium]
MSLAVSLAADTRATEHRYLETFDSRLHCDLMQTTADWDTVAGELRMQPFALNLAGIYNTAGNARGIAVDGNYAYVGDYSAGLQVINITNPAFPTLAATYNTPGYAKGVAVDGNYAYVADYATGLLVLNITNPAAPVLAATCDTDGSARDVVIEGNYAYVADYSSGLCVVNITTPAAPTLVATLALTGSPYGLAVAGNYAFIAAGTGGLQVVDITAPTAPTLAGSLDTPGSAQDVAVFGNRAYVADYDGGLRVINITHPNAPLAAGNLDLPGNANMVAVDHDRAYVAAGTAGLCEVDLRDPEAPRIVQTLDLEGNSYALALAGNRAFVATDVMGLQVVEIADWVQPVGVSWLLVGNTCYSGAIEGDYAYVNSSGAGLRVFDFSNPAYPVYVGTSGVSSGASDVAIAGDVAYVAEGTAMRVLNLTVPYAPTLITTFLPGSLAPRAIAVAGDYVFIADYAGALKVINVATPAGPVAVGSCALSDICYRLGLAVSGDNAFVANYSAGLKVINIYNLAAPAVVGTCAVPGFARDVAVDGDYAYVAAHADGLQVISIANPAAPVIVGSGETAGTAVAVAVTGDRVLVADYTSGLSVFDVTTPSVPVLAATRPGYAEGLTVCGDIALMHGSSTLAVQIYERSVDTGAGLGRSAAIASVAGDIVRARLVSTQTDSIKWEASVNAGGSWVELPGDDAWAKFASPGAALIWRSNHVYSKYHVNPTCSELQIEWLCQAAVIDAVSDIPGDQGGQVRVQFSRSGYDFADESAQPVASYYLWRRVDDPPTLKALAGAAAPPAAAERAAPAGLPLLEWCGRQVLRASDAAALGSFPAGTWEIVGSAPGVQRDQYLSAVPTLVDSTAAGTAWTVFMVTAHSTIPSVWYASAPDSGYSIDNLAPSAPGGFTVAYGADNDLTWQPCDSEDFDYFRIYRGEVQGFPADPAHLLHATVATAWSDGGGYDSFYRISAVDFAGNESEVVAPTSTTGVRDPGVTRLTLYPNQPNPFNPQTTLKCDVPVDGRVTLRVYDIRGAMIRTLIDADLPRGNHQATWDGRDSSGRGLASGSYFARLEAGGRVETVRMSLVR